MAVLWSFATSIDGADVFANASLNSFCGALLGLASFAKPSQNHDVKVTLYWSAG